VFDLLSMIFSVGSCISEFPFSASGFATKTGLSFSGLSGGEYWVSVLDSMGCSVDNSSPVLLVSPIPILVDFVDVIESYNGDDGEIIVSANGGSSPLTYSIDSINYQNEYIFSGLSAGEYTVYIKDANGCMQITYVNVPGVSIGIEQFSSNNNIELDIFPNPANDLLHIVPKNIEDIIDIRIINTLGETIKIVNISNLLNNYEIVTPLDDLISGSYILMVTTETEKLIKNIIVQKDDKVE